MEGAAHAEWSEQGCCAPRTLGPRRRLSEDGFEHTAGRRRAPCRCPPQVPELVLLEESPAEGPQQTEPQGLVLAPRQLRACSDLPWHRRAPQGPGNSPKVGPSSPNDGAAGEAAPGCPLSLPAEGPPGGCAPQGPLVCTGPCSGLGEGRTVTGALVLGEGNGNPLQYSCLENPRDGGAWWAAVYGVTQSRTRLK